MADDVWSPAQYERFRDERSEPFHDLFALIQPRPGMRILDLGCGTGELTRELHQRTGAAETIGIDTSANMLSSASALEGGGLHFLKADIAEYSSASRFDLVFSNAALQWVPAHEDLLSRLGEMVAPDGQIAVQMPANHDHPSHTAAVDVAERESFRRRLGGFVHRSPVLLPERYAALLDSLGFRRQTVRLQVYGHHLDRNEDVIEWVRGTLLTAYERRLSPADYTEFLDCYRARFLSIVSDQRPYFFTFKRVLIWGRKRAAA